MQTTLARTYLDRFGHFLFLHRHFRSPPCRDPSGTCPSHPAPSIASSDMVQAPHFAICIDVFQNARILSGALNILLSPFVHIDGKQLTFRLLPKAAFKVIRLHGKHKSQRHLWLVQGPDISISAHFGRHAIALISP